MEKKTIWQCHNPECNAQYSEYINGCPKCSTGEPGGSHKVSILDEYHPGYTKLYSPTNMEKKYIPCGGCGAEHPNDRCIGCFHPFEKEEQKKYPIESDARPTPPSFDEMVGLIKKLFSDYLEDVLKSKPADIEKSWERFKTLNHLYQDEQQPTGARWVTGQYDRLFDQLKAEPERKIVCWVDYQWRTRNSNGSFDTDICRDICAVMGRVMGFNARGIGYGGVELYIGEENEKDEFLNECERLHAQWLDEKEARP